MSANPPNGSMVPVPRSSAGSIAKAAAPVEAPVQLETSTAAAAAMARAGIEARFTMAVARPRDIMLAREKLLKACERSRFAEVAIYHKPIGKGIEGPSIRLAEEAARCMGNIDTSVDTIYEDREKRIVRVSVTDLESNLTFPQSIVIGKTVERSKVSDGQTVFSTRLNSRGQAVYEVAATEDELLNKTNKEVSKALRTLLLRVTPGDILEEAIVECYATRKREFQKDPRNEIQRMCDGFSMLQVSVKQLAEYLGHPTAECTADEVSQLRNLWASIKDRETTWSEALAARLAEMAPKPEEGAAQNAPQSAQDKPPASTPKSTSDLAAKSRAQRETAASKRLSVQGPDGKPIDTSDLPEPDDNLISRPQAGKTEPPEPGSDG